MVTMSALIALPCSFIKGAYSVLFSLRLVEFREETADRRHIYPLAILFVLSTCFISVNFVQLFLILVRNNSLPG